MDTTEEVVSIWSSTALVYTATVAWSLINTTLFMINTTVIITSKNAKYNA